MKLEEAKRLLHVDENADEETFQVALEDKFFSIKKDILPLLSVPLLIQKRQALIERWMNLEPAVNHEFLKETPLSNSSSIAQAPNAISFLERYESEISSIKLHIMNAPSFHALYHTLTAAIEVQQAYMKGFNKHFEQYQCALSEETKAREMIDTGKLLTAIKQNNIDNHTTWEIEKELARISKLHFV